MDNLNGIPVRVSSYATLQGGPVRVHTRRRWMTEAYHRRVQKKWLKRWGRTREPGAYKTPFGLVVHPTVFAKMKAELDPVCQSLGSALAPTQRNYGDLY